jgi:hypothetical protein
VAYYCPLTISQIRFKRLILRPAHQSSSGVQPKITQVIPDNAHNRATIPCLDPTAYQMLSVDGQIPAMRNVNQLLKLHLVHVAAIKFDKLIGDGARVMTRHHPHLAFAALRAIFERWAAVVFS